MRRVSLVVLTVVGALMVTVAGAQDRAESELWPDHPGARVLAEVYRTVLDDYYLLPTALDEMALWQGAIAGMVAALPDRYSRYDVPEDSARFDTLVSAGELSGIGVQLMEVDAASRLGVQVVEVFEGGPAYQAGLLAGDVILEVDGHDARRAELDDIRLLIIGQAGTVVRLLVGRAGAVAPLQFEVTRGVVDFDSSEDVNSQLLPDHVGYLSIAAFDTDEVHDLVARHLKALVEAGATALVLDLRDNLGGALTQGYEVLNEFLPNKLVWTLRFHGQDSRWVTNSWANDLPLVVLVNSRTYSMGETVAGALQQNGRALVVGERTFGKGLAVWHQNLSDGGEFTYVRHEILLPDGKSLEGIGVVPDIFAPDTRRSRLVIAGGTGAEPGQIVELSIDGAVVARTIATESGFDLIGVSQGTAFVSHTGIPADPALDSALQTAIDTVIKVRDGTDPIAGALEGHSRQ